MGFLELKMVLLYLHFLFLLFKLRLEGFSYPFVKECCFTIIYFVDIKVNLMNIMSILIMIYIVYLIGLLSEHSVFSSYPWLTS